MIVAHWSISLSSLIMSEDQEQTLLPTSPPSPLSVRISVSLCVLCIEGVLLPHTYIQYIINNVTCKLQGCNIYTACLMYICSLPCAQYVWCLLPWQQGNILTWHYYQVPLLMVIFTRLFTQILWIILHLLQYILWMCISYMHGATYVLVYLVHIHSVYN